MAITWIKYKLHDGYAPYDLLIRIWMVKNKDEPIWDTWSMSSKFVPYLYS